MFKALGKDVLKGNEVEILFEDAEFAVGTVENVIRDASFSYAFPVCHRFTIAVAEHLVNCNNLISMYRLPILTKRDRDSFHYNRQFGDAAGLLIVPES